MKSPAYPHQLPIHRQLNQLKQQIPSVWARHGPNHVCPRPWRAQRTNIQHPNMSIIAIVQKKWHEMTILRFPVLPAISASGTLWTRGRIHWLTMPKNTRKQSSALLRDEAGGTVHEYISESWVETNRFIFIICHIAYHLVPISQCLPKWLSCKRSHILTIFIAHLKTIRVVPNEAIIPSPPPRFNASLAQGRSEATDRGTPNGSLPVDAWWAPRCKLPGNNAPTLGRLGPRFKLGHHGAPIFPSYSWYH